MKTPEQSQQRRSDIFIVNFKHVQHLFPVFLLLTLGMYLFSWLDKYDTA